MKKRSSVGNFLVLISFLILLMALPFAFSVSASGSSALGIERILPHSVEISGYTNGITEASVDDAGNTVSWYRYTDITPEAFTVEFSNGVSEDYTYEDLLDFMLISESETETEQSFENQWGTGKHTAVIEIGGFICEYSVIITQNDIAGISVPDVKIKEGIDGEYIGVCDETGSFTGEYWFKYSYTPSYYTVNYKNGASENIGDISVLCGLLGVGFEDYIFSDGQSENAPWSDGIHKGTLTVGDYSCEYNVTVEDNGISSVSAIDVSLTEGTECHFDESGNCFYYNSVPEYITVTYKNGTVETIDFTDFTDESCYISEIYDGQTAETSWSTGKHTVLLYVGGSFVTEYKVEIVPSSVERIEAENVSCYEGTCGNTETFIEEDDETELEWFLYDANPVNFTVYYKDGTVKSFTYDELFKSDELCYEIITDQSYGNQWGIGEHKAVLKTVFGDHGYKVEIKEYPYTDISFEKATVKEGTNGYYSTHYDGYNAYKYYIYYTEPQKFTVTDKKGEAFTYDFTFEAFEEITGYTPCFESEQSFEEPWLSGVHTVNVLCGSQVLEYSVEIIPHGLTDIDVGKVALTQGVDGSYSLYDEEAVHFFSYDVNPSVSAVLDGNTVNTTSVNFKTDTGLDCAVNLQNPYGTAEPKPGIYTAYFCIGNSSYSFEAEIKEGIVEIISTEKIILTEKLDGTVCAYSSGDGYYYHYYPEIKEVTVKFKNGTVFTGSPEELTAMGVEAIAYDSQSETAPWKTGENKGVIVVGGKACEYTVQIVPAKAENIDCIEITPGQTVSTSLKSYSHIFYKFTPDLNGEYTFRLQGASDTYCYILDSNLNIIEGISNTESSETVLTKALTAGKTYYYVAGNYSDEDLSCVEISLAGDVCEHEFISFISNNDATCTEDGTKTAQCEHCIRKKTVTDTGSKKGHTLSGWTVTKNPSCTEQGSKKRRCANCTFAETQVISAKGHTNASAVKENYKNPTCTAEGSYDSLVYCEECRKELSRKTVKVNASGHTPETISAVAATCSASGYTEGKRCKVCNTVLEAPKETSKAAHIWIDPTCTTAKTCSVCKTTEGKALGHTEITISAVEPTCTEKGYTEGKKCSVCGKATVHQREIQAIGHFETVLPAKAATCNEKGLTEGKKCIYCDAVTVSQRVIPSLGHREITVGALEATCTENGLTEGKICTVCGKTLAAQKETSPLGHKELVLDAVESTCEAIGYTEGRRCSVCNEYVVKQKEIAATGHMEVMVYGKEATCTENGLTDGKRCAVCGKVTVAQAEVKASGHTVEILPAKKASYKTEGLTEGKVCSVCDTVIVGQKKVARKKLGKVKSLKVKKTTSSSVTLSWKKVTGAESYKIYYSTDGKKWKSVKVKKNTATIKKLKSGTQYRFKVRAFAGKYYGTASKNVKKTTKVKKPIISKITSSKKNTAVVSWKKVTRASGYVIEYSTSKSFTKKTTKTVTVKNGKAVKTTLKKLKSGKKYYVRVKAYKTVSKKTSYGSYSAVKTVKVK